MPAAEKGQIGEGKEGAGLRVEAAAVPSTRETPGPCSSAGGAGADGRVTPCSRATSSRAGHCGSPACWLPRSASQRPHLSCWISLRNVFLSSCLICRGDLLLLVNAGSAWACEQAQGAGLTGAALLGLLLVRGLCPTRGDNQPGATVLPWVVAPCCSSANVRRRC